MYLRTVRFESMLGYCGYTSSSKQMSG